MAQKTIGKGITSHYVYILQSKDGKFYTGYTTDLARRMKQHKNGKGAKFTRSFGFRKLLYHERLATRSAALKREAAIKTLTRLEKKGLFSKTDPC
ncbi:MAG: GIY-YIG nuclease family protein [Deltaproteobacteria bacterium]|nr:GIY-YIG nuclease family protein [Deltaproteobacteria bacterium]